MRFSVILTPLVAQTALAAVLCTFPLSGALAGNRNIPDLSRADEAVLDMAQAYKARDRKRLAALLPQLKGHPLEAWGAYWELSARLDEASPREIQDHLARWAGFYQEDRLRAEWLIQLGKNRDWVTFNREYPLYRMNDDRSVRCYALLANYLATGADVRPEVRTQWLGAKEAEEACTAAAEQLVKDHSGMQLTAWHRARLGMENDRIRMATQAVDLLNPEFSKTVNTIYASPTKYLNDKLTALRPRTREFVSLAIIRLADHDALDAAEEVDKLRWKAQLTQEERSWIWGVIGKRMAQRLSLDASDYFAKAQVQYLHEDHLAWMARAALRVGRWGQVLQATSAMPEPMRSEPTWVYWRAKALLQTATTDDQRNQGLRLLESIAGVKGFYEQLALEDLGQRIAQPPRPAPLSAEEKAQARQNPGLQRALYAIRIGLRMDGVREWNYSVGLHTKGGMDDRGLLAAAEYACSQEVWDRCINSSERTRSAIDWETRFPMPYRHEVIQRSRAIGLDPAYVYGLIRQESRFITDARSGVGAAGLMQVMPATAKWTAKKLGMTGFQPHDITDKDTNIAIGTGYLKLVLDSFGGSMPMAAAAYNAGPGRPRQWRGGDGAPTVDAVIWAENIPFNETRDYVKKVLSNTTNYAALITGQPQSLKARLGQIGPSNAPPLIEDLP
ncbi:transglycosylase SLT domain-containing protein [Curvibacter sp. APW13]|uniref:lytic transglycosylase domain-containing protein n=1 Tax=Curvibacter sp. APW13 TaxID=3077236 RepID=UPI0028E09953|nr:transglycosylase SLT domain-containing protein [Curvibacter sp. APW13]MDT8993009.1 transglycosylase SLT domain-containing protein [Curvibacter sp. APW13]